MSIELSGVSSSNYNSVNREIELPPPRKQPKQNELVEAKLEWGYFQQIGVAGGGEKDKLMLEGTKESPFVTAGNTKISIEARGIVIDLENGVKLVLKASKEDPLKLVIAAFKDGKMLANDLKVADGAGTINIPMGEGKGDATMSLSIGGGKLKGFTIDSGDGAILNGKSNGNNGFSIQKVDNASITAPEARGAQKIKIDSSGGIEVKVGVSQELQKAWQVAAMLQNDSDILSNSEYMQKSVNDSMKVEMQQRVTQRQTMLSIQLA